VDAAWEINSLNFQASANGFTLDGKALRIEKGGIVSSAQRTQKISTPIIVGLDQAWRGSGSIDFTGPITLLGVLNLNPGAKDTAFDLQNVIDGKAPLLISGVGQTHLGGANTSFGGPVTVAGFLAISNESALGIPDVATTIEKGGI